LIRGRGLDVYVLDLTSLLNPQYLEKYTPNNLVNDQNIIIFKSRQDLERALKEKGKTIFVVDFIGADYSNLFIYRYFKKYGILYASFCANTLPLSRAPKEKSWPKKIMTKVTKVFSTKFFRKAINYFLIRSFFYVCKILQHIGYIKGPDYMLVGGGKIVSTYPLSTAATSIIYGHTLDYDIILKEKIIPQDNSYAVFIDQYVPYHPDAIISNVDKIDAEKYYKGLNRFFDWFEDKFKQEVVIAAHPRSNYDQKPQCFSNRKIIKGRTIEVIAGANYVITHGSTAVTFAVCFNKPLVFLTCDMFERTYHGIHINASANQFGKTPINVDRPYEKLDISLVSDESLYLDYFEKYIKTQGSPQKQFWEIVIDELQTIKK